MKVLKGLEYNQTHVLLLLNIFNVLPLSLFVNRVGGTLEGSERPTDQVGQLHQRQK